MGIFSHSDHTASLLICSLQLSSESIIAGTEQQSRLKEGKAFLNGKPAFLYNQEKVLLRYTRHKCFQYQDVKGEMLDLLVSEIVGNLAAAANLIYPSQTDITMHGSEEKCRSEKGCAGNCY